MSAREKPTLPFEDNEEALREQDEFLDEALEETFPASDPIAPGGARRFPAGEAEMPSTSI